MENERCQERNSCTEENDGVWWCVHCPIESKCVYSNVLQNILQLIVYLPFFVLSSSTLIQRS